jgi:mRNA-degrading endonuclease RelE of RelBE toxin-antitoxin system
VGEAPAPPRLSRHKRSKSQPPKTNQDGDAAEGHTGHDGETASDRRRSLRRHANVKPLTGAKDAFRLRQDDWRAIYQIDRKSDTIQVTAVGPRGSVYE